MFILNNNCYYYGDTALCGTRGWFYEQEQEGTHDEKIFRRELGRLEASFKAAGRAGKDVLSPLSAAVPRLRMPGNSASCLRVMA